MSWIYGVLQKKGILNANFKLKEECRSLERKNFYLALDKQSYLLTSEENNIEAVIGVPIVTFNSKKIILTEKNLNSITTITPNELDGHFIHLKFENEKLKIQNDIFGLRDLYFINSKEQFIFSSRIDLLAKHLKKLSLKSANFSSLWLTNFQLSHNSILNEIQRLGPGGKILIDKNQINIHNNKFKKIGSIQNPKEIFQNLLSEFCLIQSEYDKSSLGLSGGIDSRIVLSFLLKEKDNFVCHSILNEEDKDLKVSKEICEKLNIELNLIEREKINLTDYENDILNFYQNISPVIPLTQLLDFGIFGVNYLKNYLILDGGFGGFFRGQYLKKIRLQGYEKFNLDNWQNVKKNLYAPKPKIFNKDFISILERDLDESVIRFMEKFGNLKSNEEMLEVLDLIAVHFMLSNIYNPGQTILDQKFNAFMPLAQKEVINTGMNISFKAKVDSKYFKNIIKNNNQLLSKIGLVNNNLENPYWLNYKFVMLRLLLSRKFSKKNNFERYKILYNSKEYILDLLSQKSTKENIYLNSKVNGKFAKEFFKGDLSKGYFIDWLLAFILWYRANNLG
ncbi:MAG: hypothetical protein CR986_01285 [Ignavibacteriae bacterium]|nr:MAG: hypothetical protein CR986_01285 [Ignavibacteriota bacterium]